MASVAFPDIVGCPAGTKYTWRDQTCQVFLVFMFLIKMPWLKIADQFTARLVEMNSPCDAYRRRCWPLGYLTLISSFMGYVRPALDYFIKVYVHELARYFYMNPNGPTHWFLIFFYANSFWFIWFGDWTFTRCVLCMNVLTLPAHFFDWGFTITMLDEVQQGVSECHLEFTHLKCVRKRFLCIQVRNTIYEYQRCRVLEFR